jgi:hypothetical protein
MGNLQIVAKGHRILRGGALEAIQRGLESLPCQDVEGYVRGDAAGAG